MCPPYPALSLIQLSIVLGSTFGSLLFDGSVYCMTVGAAKSPQLPRCHWPSLILANHFLCWISVDWRCYFDTPTREVKRNLPAQRWRGG